MATPSSKVQSLINAGVVMNYDKLTLEMQTRLETLSESEITHLIAIKEKLGEEHLKANAGMIWN